MDLNNFAYTSFLLLLMRVGKTDINHYVHILINYFINFQVIYIYDLDLVWRMQSMIIKCYKFGCMCRELFTLNTFFYRICHIKSESDLFLYTRNL